MSDPLDNNAFRVVTGPSGRSIIINSTFHPLAPNELVGANSGQRPDLLAWPERVYQLTTDPTLLYHSNGTQLVVVPEQGSHQIVYDNLSPVMRVNSTGDLVDADGNFIASVPLGTTYDEYNTYADLPVSPPNPTTAIVLTATGVPFINRKYAGLYRFTTVWVYLGPLPEGYFTDNVTAFFDDADPSKQLKWELAGIGSGQTRVASWPDKSGTVAMLDDMVPGPQGPVGPQGPQGMQGDDGLDGDIGPGGPAGATGPQGSVGPQGPQGIMGPVGMDGLDGDAGLQGPAGPQGIQGNPGSAGAAGAVGPPGVDGASGDDGAMGPPGPAGPQGPAGATGAAGPSGANGMDGDPGLDGDPGPPGSTGPQGLQGITGSQGPIGYPSLVFESSDDEPEIRPPDRPGLLALHFPPVVAVADQAIAAATLTLLTGTLVKPLGLYVGQVFRWQIVGTAAAAGTAANTIAVRWGTAGTTADAVVGTVTTAVGTAAISEYVIDVTLTIRTLGGTATAVMNVNIRNSAATGFVNTTQSVLNGTMSSFNSVLAGFFHVSLTTGASKTATIRQAYATVAAPSNPQIIHFQ